MVAACRVRNWLGGMGAGRQGVVVSRGNSLDGGESGLVVADAACGVGGSGWEGLERATSGG